MVAKGGAKGHLSHTPFARKDPFRTTFRTPFRTTKKWERGARGEVVNGGRGGGVELEGDSESGEGGGMGAELSCIWRGAEGAGRDGGFGGWMG